MPDYPVPVILAALAWLQAGKKKVRVHLLPTIITLTVLLAGVLGAAWMGQYREQTLRNALLQRTIAASMLVSPAVVTALAGSRQDVGNARYITLYKLLSADLASYTDARDLYLLRQRGQSIIFLVDTDAALVEAPIYPGTTFDEATPRIRAAFRAGVPFVEGPNTDRWGIWMSGFVPIKESENGQVVALLGMDIDARQWRRSVLAYRLLPLICSVLLLVLMIPVFAGIRLVRHLKTRAAISEDRYRQVVESIREVVFQTDAQGLWIYLNPAWSEITGFSLDESLGTLFLNYVHPDDRARNQELFGPLIRREKAYCHHSVRYLTKDGGFRWIEVHARLTFAETGEVNGTAGTLRDITKSHQAEEALRARDRILHGTAAALNVLLGEVDYTQAIDQVLQILGEATNVDRIFLFENSRDTTTSEVLTNLRFRWASASQTNLPAIADLQRLPLERGRPRWYEILTDARAVVGIVKDFPAPERQELHAFG
ncbi:MAG TPA: PAS domain S-box protein, partial [Armatimonadota bacterium]